MAADWRAGRNRKCQMGVLRLEGTSGFTKARAQEAAYSASTHDGDAQASATASLAELRELVRGDQSAAMWALALPDTVGEIADRNRLACW